MDHACAIQAGSGAVVCWGDNSVGEATPPSSLNGVRGTATAIATTREHTLAIRTPECSDGIDNDGNGLADYPADPGCEDLADVSEGCDVDGSGVIDRSDVQAIVDGIGTTVAADDPRDADGDGKVTIFDSAACANECTFAQCAACGLLGIEPVLVLIALRGTRSLRTRRAARRR
ncbi:MAG TPA: hypothetical protein VMS22_04220 [Candidatus Eisenbacteria bacterium]|nr:hypothetical protein [Candidatus Eisenbacteria bacterium]